ncbi:GSU2403 family nucleotidyltransferase fold protein [Mesorhizobium sp. CC13]
MGYRSPRRADREPIKRRRDFAQAEAVAQLAATYFEHLPFDATAMQALPKTVFKAANLKFAR